MWPTLVEGVVGPVVINCDRDTQRWSDLCEHLATWDVTPSRFSAFTSTTRRKSPFVPRTSALMTLGVVEILKQFQKTDQPYVLVLEDDCRFLQDPRVAVSEAIAACPVGWSVLSLGSWGQIPPTDYSRVTYAQPLWLLLGAHSVLVSRQHVEGLIQSLDSSLPLFDIQLNEEYRKKRGYVRRPSITYQHEYVSHRSKRKEPTIALADLPQEQKKILQTKTPTPFPTSGFK
jgi:hypothetical protein